MAAIYFFIWAAFVWSCCVHFSFALNNMCPSVCSCLGDYVDCSRMGLIEVPKDLPTWVTDLEIQSNDISTLHPDDFKNLTRLTKIDLTNNKISSINASIFQHVPTLRELKINSNKLTELPMLMENPLLTRLELTHNNIHTINATVLSRLPRLDILDLAHNDILDLPNGTFPENLTLTKLFLRNNKIFYFGSGCLYNLTTLQSLKLNKNKISHLPKGMFAKSTSLRSLDLSKNQLSKLPGLTFQGARNLEVLKLRKNGLNKLEDGAFFGLSKLHQLLLDENNLTVISQNWLYGLDTLRELSLSHNKISKIESKAWEYAPPPRHLVSLNLNNNGLVTIMQDSFASLSKLKTLQLANNHIEIIQDDAFKELSALEELDLNNNAISSTIEDVKGAFVGLSTLKVLRLASNKIKTITKQAFTGLDGLEQLFLENNNITSIQGKAFEPVPQLRKLMFNTTSLFCDCQLSWVPIWLRDNNFEHDVVAKCAHPDYLKGKNLFVVDSNEFKCEGHFPKPVIISHPKSQVVLKGENITLNCSAASTEKQGSTTWFQWKKDNMLLDDASMENHANHSDSLTNYVSKLTIRDAQDTDAGRYQCVISNEFGSAYSKRANINVYVYPVFTKRPQNVTVKARSKATLVCAAEGQPKPTITWQKGGGFDHFPAAQERRMHVIPEDDHFYIVDVKAADEGVYTCIAKNDAGTIAANVTLTVLQTPSFVRPMEPKQTKVGLTAVLECLAQGSPQPRLTWYRDAKPLVLSQRHFFTAGNQLLVIVETETSDAGEYTCEMSNTLGTIRGKSTLTVITAANPGEAKTEKGQGGGLDDESTTTGIIIIAVVCCVVGTSLVWVIIIYQTRKRQELYSATPTDETTLPGEVPSSGYMSSDKEGSYLQGVPVTTVPGYQYQDMQMKESGYESSSGRFRAARPAAIFPSDVDGEGMHEGYSLIAPDAHYIEQSDENSLSSHEYPRSDTDSLKSELNSVGSSQSSGRQQPVLTTFHPHATASQELLTRSRSHSQTVCDRTSEQTAQCAETEEPHENSVSSQTDDNLGCDIDPTASVCDSDPTTAAGRDSDTTAGRYGGVCRTCREEGLLRDTNTCKHNSPAVPPKPWQPRRGRRREHTHFDRAQPPGISRSSGDIQSCLVTTPVYDDNIPPHITCPSIYVRPDQAPQEGIFLPNGGSVGTPGAFVPVYHPVNTPCDCHMHYPPPTSYTRSRDQRQHKDLNTLTNPRNQRVNGVIGCVHHHMNGMNGSWHGHSYTLPYLPASQAQQHPVPIRRSPRDHTQQTSPHHKEHNSLPRQQVARSLRTSISASERGGSSQAVDL